MAKKPSEWFGVAGKAERGPLYFLINGAVVEARWEGKKIVANRGWKFGERLQAIDMDPEGRVCAVSTQGSFWWFEDDTWTMTAAGTGSLNAVCSFAPRTAIACGEGGDRVHYDRGQLSVVRDEWVAPLFSIHASAASRIVAVGGAGTILRFDGSRWHGECVDPEQYFFSVSGAEDRIWIAGGSRTGSAIHTSDHDSWKPIALPLDRTDIKSVSCHGDDVWFAAYGAGVFRWHENQLTQSHHVGGLVHTRWIGETLWALGFKVALYFQRGEWKQIGSDFVDRIELVPARSKVKRAAKVAGKRSTSDRALGSRTLNVPGTGLVKTRSLPHQLDLNALLHTYRCSRSARASYLERKTPCPFSRVSEELAVIGYLLGEDREQFFFHLRESLADTLSVRRERSFPELVEILTNAILVKDSAARQRVLNVEVSGDDDWAPLFVALCACANPDAATRTERLERARLLLSQRETKAQQRFGPMLAVLQAISAKDKKAVAAAWRKCETVWRRRYGSKQPSSNPDGILDLGLLAVGILALEQGVEVPSTNPYAPPDLMSR